MTCTTRSTSGAMPVMPRPLSTPTTSPSTAVPCSRQPGASIGAPWMCAMRVPGRSSWPGFQPPSMSANHTPLPRAPRLHAAATSMPCRRGAEITLRGSNDGVVIGQPSSATDGSASTGATNASSTSGSAASRASRGRRGERGTSRRYQPASRGVDACVNSGRATMWRAWTCSSTSCSSVLSTQHKMHTAINRAIASTR